MLAIIRNGANISGCMSLDTGAAAALTRLEKEERDAYAEMERFKGELAKFEKDRGKKFFDDHAELARKNLLDASLMSAVERWGKLLKSLREYENAIAPEKRGEGEKITQKEASRIVEMIITLLWLGLDGGLVAISQDVLRLKKSEDIYAHCSKIFKRTIFDLLETGVREEKLPAWVVPDQPKSL